MSLTTILSEIDEEIAKLKGARAVLSGEAVKRSPGRPKKATPATKNGTKKRNLSPEGRKRIAEAVRRRWAAQKKAAAK